ncbi:glycine zipper 2TM domain-containing protein [Arenimonas sp.]|uniref:glycine zipper 2TM domain-containing protein n=1 Tax=Arenimonas sp. TaxID=1872635 RepID=UPI0025D530E3|nr:glycine zipper 2TM domain-containing protein [Arenimonas sp.]
MKTRILAVAALSVTLAACASSQPRNAYGGYDSYDRGYAQRCYDCGRIERIEQVYGVRENSRTGAVLGGIVGAVAAREIPTHGSDGKRNTATVAGAVAGAVAGNAIENKVNEATFDIHVRMDNGRLIVINRNSLPSGVREGAYVRVEGTRITPLR